EVFALRRFHVDAGVAKVVDDGGPLPLPAPAQPATLPEPVAAVVEQLGEQGVKLPVERLPLPLG
ncbi:MAG TPA: hypothetical protein VFR97_10470, partial [Capillimicrobium sp.]|nr:hypothetical protein [Capillimicrobium sp.]